MALPSMDPDLLRGILDNSGHAVYLKDATGRYLFVNHQFELWSKSTFAQILGKTDLEIFPESIALLFVDQDRQVREARRAIEFEESILLPDGVFTFITRKFPLFQADGAVRAVGGVCTDITARSQVHAETLSAERARLVATLCSIGEAVISTDTHGRILLLNEIASALTGWSAREARGRHVEEVLRLVATEADPTPPMLVRNLLAEELESTGSMTRASNSGAMELSGAHLVDRGGQRRWIDASGAAVRDRLGRKIGMVVAFRDVTERRQAQEELFRARKLDSLGTLASGVAHDFNNLLVGILANVEHAARQLAHDAPGGFAGVRQALDTATNAALRARDLTRQILTFARGGDSVPTVGPIAEIIREAATLAVSGEAVTCALDLAEDLLPVEVDRGQLHQVIQNLVVNARQAMPAGGVVRVSAKNRMLPRDPRFPHGPIGACVEIAVVDDGCGIPPEHMDRVLDPWFTTRKGGTGLGLSVAHSVVRRHGGRMEIESPVRESGRGSCFRVLLPGASPSVVAAATVAAVSKSPTAPVKPTERSGRILVLDDTEIVRKALGIMLEGLGFRVVFAEEGQQMLDQYRQALASGDPISLLIVDLTIAGGMSGLAAVEQILALDPKARAIVTSGYADSPVLTDFRRHGFVGMLGKPFTLGELQEQVETALGAARS